MDRTSLQTRRRFIQLATYVCATRGSDWVRKMPISSNWIFLPWATSGFIPVGTSSFRGSFWWWQASNLAICSDIFEFSLLANYPAQSGGEKGVLPFHVLLGCSVVQGWIYFGREQDKRKYELRFERNITIVSSFWSFRDAPGKNFEKQKVMFSIQEPIWN